MMLTLCSLLEFIWDDGESSYRVEDSGGGEVGWCSWSEPGDSEECEDGLDVYNMANVMECKSSTG